MAWSTMHQGMWIMKASTRAHCPLLLSYALTYGILAFSVLSSNAEAQPRDCKCLLCPASTNMLSPELASGSGGTLAVGSKHRVPLRCYSTKPCNAPLHIPRCPYVMSKCHTAFLLPCGPEWPALVSLACALHEGIGTLSISCKASTQVLVRGCHHWSTLCNSMMQA